MDGRPLRFMGEKRESRRNSAVDYEKLFQRNYGIFSRDEQQRIRQASILILGCGGIGGLVAIILARSGVSQFVDFDSYEPTNMNRQIACFVDTIGRNKA
jgi:tRNA A37 threonylcarbamoyladenosine dehydratase